MYRAAQNKNKHIKQYLQLFKKIKDARLYKSIHDNRNMNSMFLQCFDTVGWATGWAIACKNCSNNPKGFCRQISGDQA